MAATLATLVAFWVLVPPTYLTNDDVAIRRDLEGLTAPGAAPTGYVLMAHSLLGWTLVMLQRVLVVHMWDVVVAALLIWAIAVAVTIAWSIGGSSAERTLMLAAVLVTVAPFLAGMQFTISATLAGAAAVTAVLIEVFEPKPRRSVLIMASALLLLGLLVRAMGATAGGLLALALVVPAVLADRGARSTLVRRLVIVSTAVSLSAIAVVYLDDAIYQLSPPWAAYHQNNWVTARLFEWGGDLPASVIAPLRERVGWTDNDFNMLGRWWGVDPQVHSLAHINGLYSAWSGLVDWRLRLDWLTQRARSDVTVATVVRLISDSAPACVAALLVVAAVASWRGVAGAIAAAAVFIAACMTMEIGFKELPFRLFAPLQACFVLAIVVIASRNRRAPRMLPIAAAALAAAGLFAHAAQASIADARADSRQSRETDAQVADLLQLHPSLLVLHADSFPSEHWWRPFHTPPVQLAALQLGLNNANPYVQRFLDARFQPSLLHAICSDPSILVVAEEGRLDPVTVFMREHYGMRVEWERVYDGSFRVWRCSTRGHS